MRTKTITIATLVALIAAYGAAQAVKEEIDKGNVSVMGGWLPSPRTDKVQVSVSVGSNTTTTTHLSAPFGPKVYKVSRGTRVMIRLRLLGESGGKFLGCIVKVDGIEVMSTPNHSSVAPGTEVFCWAVA